MLIHIARVSFSATRTHQICKGLDSSHHRLSLPSNYHNPSAQIPQRLCSVPIYPSSSEISHCPLSSTALANPSKTSLSALNIHCTPTTLLSCPSQGSTQSTFSSPNSFASVAKGLSIAPSCPVLTAPLTNPNFLSALGLVAKPYLLFQTTRFQSCASRSLSSQRSQEGRVARKDLGTRSARSVPACRE